MLCLLRYTMMEVRAKKDEEYACSYIQNKKQK